MKIGRSDSPEARCRQLQTGSAATLNVLATMQGHVEEENALHRYFSNKSIGDEWFDFGGEDAVATVVTGLPLALAAAAERRTPRRRRQLPPNQGETTRLTVDMKRADLRAVRAVADEMADQLQVSKVPTMTLMAALGRLVTVDANVQASVQAMLSADIDRYTNSPET